MSARHAAPRMWRRAGRLAVGALFFAAVIGGVSGQAVAGLLIVGAGSKLDLGDGTLSLGCSDLEVEGTLAITRGILAATRSLSIPAGGTLVGDEGSIALGGDWSNAGTFIAGSSRVAIDDTCQVATSTLSGSNTFANLSLTSAKGKVFWLAASSTQTISGTLSLAGVEGALLILESTVEDEEAFIDLQGSHTPISWVDVADVHSIGNTLTAGLGSVTSGNTSGWDFAVLVPALLAPGVALLALALVWAGCAVARSRGRA